MVLAIVNEWSDERVSAPSARSVVNRLPEMELATDRVRFYELRGLPPEQLILTFEVVGRRLIEEEDFSALSGVGTRMSVTIVDDHGTTVCSANGPLKDWVLTRSHQYAAYWHDGCARPRLHDGRAYTMTVSVTGDCVTPPLVVVPTPEGGGIELP
jgi:hypothetical protein